MAEQLPENPSQNICNPKTCCNNNTASAEMFEPELTEQYHTFLDNSTPVNDKIEKRSYACYYNSNGQLRSIQPLVTRNDLAKYLNKNGSLLKNTRKRFFINDKKNFQSQAYRTNNFCHFVSKSIDHELPFRRCAFPLINNRYNNKFSKNKKNLFNNNNYSSVNNNEIENDILVNNDLNNNNAVNLKTINRKEDEKCCKKDMMLNKYKSGNFIVNPDFYRRTFHKAQIFNNYKPYLVENFRMFADYC